jgi:Tfp pilus assembly protein PilE
MTMKNESGRSMVEMLGVLAIIGVLSIGGIAGYTMAMNRYRANEIVDAASKTAIIAMTANGGQGAARTFADAGGSTLPCTTAAGISSTDAGVVSINLNADCTGVATAIQNIAGGRLVGQSCTVGALANCQLNFGDVAVVQNNNQQGGQQGGQQAGQN